MTAWTLSRRVLTLIELLFSGSPGAEACIEKWLFCLIFNYLYYLKMSLVIIVFPSRLFDVSRLRDSDTITPPYKGFRRHGQ
jgi:hypothetical protein